MHQFQLSYLIMKILNVSSNIFNNNYMLKEFLKGIKSGYNNIVVKEYFYDPKQEKG
jgi:hypothetical protein